MAVKTSKHQTRKPRQFLVGNYRPSQRMQVGAKFWGSTGFASGVAAFYFDKQKNEVNGTDSFASAPQTNYTEATYKMLAALPGRVPDVVVDGDDDL